MKGERRQGRVGYWWKRNTKRKRRVSVVEVV